MDIQFKIYDSPYGKLKIATYDNRLIMCDWLYRKMRINLDNRMCKNLESDFVDTNNEIITDTIHQLEEYFKSERKQFDLPIKLVGTEFQQKVWNCLMRVEYGTTISYLGLSEILGDKKAIRAVANANGANAISIIVPCHRIIGKNGHLTGYAGGLKVKKKLLQIEGAAKQMTLF